MAVTDSQLSKLITGTGDLAGASLGTRIILNRLRVQARAEPASLSQRIAELREFVAKNPGADAELSKV